MALRLMLRQSATQTWAAMDAIKSAQKGERGPLVAKYAELRERHVMLQSLVYQTAAELGRGVRAFKKLPGQDEELVLNQYLQESTGKTFNQLEEEAVAGANLRTPGQVSQFINSVKRGKLRDAVLEYYINALISGPVTHLRYSVGNALNAIWTPLIETPAAALSHAVLGGEEKVGWNEVGAQLLAIGKGSRDGWSAAVEAFKTGISTALPGEKVPEQFAQRVNAIPGAVGRAINIPSRSVSTIHSFFKSLRYEQNIQRLAYRQATSEGLEGDAFTNRIVELTTTPPDGMITEAQAGMQGAATKEAMKSLYMAPSDYHSALGTLTRFTNKSMIAKIMVPFMKIGGQITREAFVERTPLGIALSKEVRANVLGANGAAARDLQVGKMSAGIALMGMTSLMVAEGMATGDGPSDPAKRADWLLTNKPNTLTVGGLSIPYQGLGSLGMLMRFSANMTETAEHWSDEDGGKLALSFLEGITKSVLDENFMRGVKDAMDAVYHPEEYGERYIQSFITNWLPYSVGLGQVAREVDPFSREAHGIIEAAQAKIAGLSSQLHPRYDMFGNPIPSGGSIPAAMTANRYKNDPVVNALQSLDIGVGRLSKKIRGVQLSGQQFDDYSRIAGRYTKARLDAFVNNPGFSKIPTFAKVETIHKIITTSREEAAKVVMSQSIGKPDDIVKQAVDAMKAKRVEPVR